MLSPSSIQRWDSNQQPLDTSLLNNNSRPRYNCLSLLNAVVSARSIALVNFPLKLIS